MNPAAVLEDHTHTARGEVGRRHCISGSALTSRRTEAGFQTYRKSQDCLSVRCIRYMHACMQTYIYIYVYILMRS